MVNAQSQFIGATGQYYVAYGLSSRWLHATITLGNAMGVDILCANANGTSSLSIQVKTANNAAKNSYGETGFNWEDEELTESQDRYLQEDDSPFLIQDKSYLILCNPDCLTMGIYSATDEAVENFSAIETFFQKMPNPQNKLEILEPNDLDGVDMICILSGMYPSRIRMLEY